MLILCEEESGPGIGMLCLESTEFLVFRKCMIKIFESQFLTNSTSFGYALLGWKKSFEKINTQTTCEFMVISQLLGGQF